MSSRPIFIVWCGKRSYGPMLDLQQHVFASKIARQKEIQRSMRANEPLSGGKQALPDVVLCVEHAAPVYTMGRRDTADGLRLGETTVSVKDDGTPLMKDGIPVVMTKRGGGLTWHGPGQMTCYPIVNLQDWWRQCLDDPAAKGKSPTRWFANMLEASLIHTCAAYGVGAHRQCTGVWCTKFNSDEPRKVGSIGLQLSDWVSMHGIGFNVCNDLTHFDKIVMCELPDRRATNLHTEIGDRSPSTGTVLPDVESVFKIWSRQFTIATNLPDSVDFHSVDMTNVPDDQLQEAIDCLRLGTRN